MRVLVERIRSRAPCDRRAGGHPDSEVRGPEHRCTPALPSPAEACSEQEHGSLNSSSASSVCTRRCRQRGQSLAELAAPAPGGAHFPLWKNHWRRGGTGGACTARRRQAAPQASEGPGSCGLSAHPSCLPLCFLPLFLPSLPRAPVVPPRPAGARSPWRGQLTHALARLVAEG